MNPEYIKVTCPSCGDDFIVSRLRLESQAHVKCPRTECGREFPATTFLAELAETVFTNELERPVAPSSDLPKDD